MTQAICEKIPEICQNRYFTSDNQLKTAFVKNTRVRETVCESFFTRDKKAKLSFVANCEKTEYSKIVKNCEKATFHNVGFIQKDVQVSKMAQLLSIEL